jgi:hypothetical protein
MNENDSNKESGAVARAAGEFLGNALGAFITLGVTGVGVYFAWNYALHEIIHVEEMKYYHSLLIIAGWRCLVYKT